MPFALFTRERAADGSRPAVDRSPPTSTSAATSTASPPHRAARTKTACGRDWARPCATSSRRTTLSPKGVTISAEDIREGVVGILSIFMPEPQFQGQTKDRLNNPEVVSTVDSIVRPALEQWLNENRSVAEAIVGRIILAARAREASRAAQQEVTRKSATSSRLTLPGKLSDCTSPDRARQRAVHRRRGLCRRIGEAGARPDAAGDPAAARQGAEHRERVARQGDGEQGAVGPGHGDRLRPGQEASTFRACATARSSSSPTPTRTATTSRRCCSPSSTGTCRS